MLTLIGIFCAPYDRFERQADRDTTIRGGSTMGRFRRTACALVASGVLMTGVGAALAGPASAHPTHMKKKAVAAATVKKIHQCKLGSNNPHCMPRPK